MGYTTYKFLCTPLRAHTLCSSIYWENKQRGSMQQNKVSTRILVMAIFNKNRICFSTFNCILYFARFHLSLAVNNIA